MNTITMADIHRWRKNYQAWDKSGTHTNLVLCNENGEIVLIHINRNTQAHQMATEIIVGGGIRMMNPKWYRIDSAEAEIEKLINPQSDQSWMLTLDWMK